MFFVVFKGKGEYTFGCMNQNVVDYIERGRSQGASDQIIRQKLLESGWAENIINESFLVSQKPVAESRVVAKSEDLVSPYSQIMAILLAVSLFVLTNGIFSDIKNNIENTNKTLLYEGLFVVPFLLIGLSIYNSMEDKKRFRILSLPYFAMSAWLTVKLLWKVGAYILDKNAALGVYVVLGAIVVILTGIIIFTQKHTHKES